MENTVTGSDVSLYTLVTRLLPRRGHPGDAAHELRLVPGELPDGLPLPHPLLPGALIIGAVVDGPYATILLDTDHAPKRAAALIQEALVKDGWIALETGRARGGFEHANHAHGMFWRTELGAKLTLNAHAYPGSPTQVRLDLDLTPTGPSSHPDQRPPHPGPIPSLPELAPPAGARLQTMGGEASPLGTSAQAELITPLDLGAVATHYAEQMRDTGCVAWDCGQGDSLAWSTWTLDDPDHGPSQCLFLALQQMDDPTRYFLYERVTWAPPIG